MRIHLLKRAISGLDLEQEEARGFLSRLTPVVLVDDLVPAEIGGSEAQWRRCVGGHYQGAVAGQYSQIQLRNPPNSGVLVVVDKALVALSTAGLVDIWQDVGGYTSASTNKGFCDQRQAGSPTAELRYAANAAHLGDNLYGYVRVGTTPVEIPGPFILEGMGGGWPSAGGQAIGFETNVLNVSLTVTFFWRERDYHPIR